MEYSPNYKDGSIVNLMSSIASAYGKSPRYKNLKSLDPGSLKDSKNIVLVVLDGLGYEYLKRYGKNSFLKKHTKGKMTTVFPSTTASALTTFHTGLAPQQHALTGWFVHLKEFGCVSTILPFVPRYGSRPFTKDGLFFRDCFNAVPFYDNLPVKSYTIHPDYLLKSEYNRTILKKSKRYYYKTLAGFVSTIKKTVKKKEKNNPRKYIYAYWPSFDSLCHQVGPSSKYALKHFREIDKSMAKLYRSLKGTDSTVIITADHGLIDTPADRKIWLNLHLGIYDCLSMPLSGDSRVAQCFVRPSKVKQFESLVKKELSHCCTMYKGEEFIKKGYFGLYEPNPLLFDRVGDYVLILKENYSMRDFMPNDQMVIHLGSHSGLSKEEMFVPLIVLKC